MQQFFREGGGGDLLHVKTEMHFFDIIIAVEVEVIQPCTFCLLGQIICFEATNLWLVRRPLTFSFSGVFTANNINAFSLVQSFLSNRITVAVGGVY